MTGHTAAVLGLYFSPDGSLIATSSIDETIKIWTREGVLITTLTGHHAVLADEAKLCTCRFNQIPLK